jgi:deoxyribonuclease-4
MHLGLHVDMRGGYLQALRHAQELDCAAMQMLSYRRHHEPTDSELAEFRSAFEKSSIKKLALHVRYLPGLGSKDRERRERSVQLLARELRLAEALGGNWLILHLGAYSPDSTPAEAMAWFAKGIAEAVAQTGAKIPIVVENVPGGGRRMGGSLEELATFLDVLGKQGQCGQVCLDTAHAWAYGYEIDSQEGMWRFLGKAHKLFGSSQIPVFHLNDSQAPTGSHREHHWHWGKGFLGDEGLRALLARPEYSDAAGILEMPPGRDLESLAFVSQLS